MQELKEKRPEGVSLPQTADGLNWKVATGAMIFGDAKIKEEPKSTMVDESNLRLNLDLNSETVKSDEKLFEEVSPYYKELNDFITELRLENVSSDNVNPDQQKLIDRLNTLYSPYNSWAADMAREKQERQQAEMRQREEEADAQRLMAQAEALLANIDTTDFASLESIKSQLIVLAVKFASNSALADKIDSVVDKLRALTNKEVKV